MCSSSGRGAISKHRWSEWLAPLVVAVTALVAFVPVLGNGFVTWDDDRNFLTNPHYRGLGADQLRWMWTTFHLGHYVPLSWMTFGLDYEIWGMQPGGYHLTNLLLHALNAVLLFILARSLFERAAPSASRGRILLAATVAALFFALHPLRVESVAWVTERRDVLSLAFMLLTVMAYLHFVEATTRRATFYALALAGFACALLSKATVMTLPAVLLVINVFPLKRLTRPLLGNAARRVYLEVLPFAVMSAAAIALSMVALDPPPQLSLGGKVAVSAYSLAFYLWKTVAPTGLAPLYQMPRVIDAGAGRFVISYAVVIAYAALLWITARRRPGVFAALLAFLVLLLPMLGVVQNGPQIAADRYTYHAAPALAMLIGAAFIVLRFTMLSAAAATAGVGMLALGALTWQQALVWRTSNALWARVVEVDPASSIGHSSLASLLYEQGDLAAASEHSARALELDPGSSSAHTAVGMSLARQGRFADAVAEYERALALSPANDQAENDWGIALAQQGNAAGAIEHYQRAASLNADNADAQVNWGNALVRLDRVDEAIPHYQAALVIRPDHAEAHHNWGVALARSGRYPEAADQFRAALAINPAHAEAREYLDKVNALMR